MLSLNVVDIVAPEGIASRHIEKKYSFTISCCQGVILSPVQEFAIACSLQRRTLRQPEVSESSHKLCLSVKCPKLCLCALQQHVQQSLLAYCFHC